MKRLMIFVVGLVFVLSTVAFAAEKPAGAAAKAKEPAAAVEKAPAAAEKAPAAAEKAPAAAPKAAPAKVAKMTAKGTVKEVSDVALKIERTVKGKAETMEFTLEKPLTEIKAGDKVTVNYEEKDGKNIATKVEKAAAKKEKKEKKEKK